MSSDSSSRSPEDTFKILIATDCHLGYEYTKRRGNQVHDSFVTFEEILRYAKEHDVDFILLGGDLFHDTQPSQYAMLNCLNLLRKYCLGSRDIKMEFLSDPEEIFQHSVHKNVNYEDDNLNVSIPVFSIHGNHDDPSFGAIGILDILSSTGLVNYFGKWTDLTKVNVAPLVLRKGETYISLYGLSYINDERLSRLFRDSKVNMLIPEGIPECFNIFVLHQNRARHQQYAYVPDQVLPKFLNFVVWGHEHECRVTPEPMTDRSTVICQPGSSIATSLCEGEAKPKHIGLLYVNKMSFKFKKLPLKTVRPFVFDNLILEEHNIAKTYAKSLSDSVYDFVDNYIQNELIPKAAEQLTGHPKQPIQPFIRLRIFHTKDDEQFETVRLAQKYCEEVANPMTMILFRKEKKASQKPRSRRHNVVPGDDASVEGVFREDDNDDDNDDYDDEEIKWHRTVIGGVEKYFGELQNKNKLMVLSVPRLSDGFLSKYVELDDGSLLRSVARQQISKAVEYLKNKDVDTKQDIEEELKKYQEYTLASDSQTSDYADSLEIATSRDCYLSNSIGSDDEEDDTEKEIASGKGSKSSGTRGTRGTRGARGTRGTRGARGTRGTATDARSKAKSGRGSPGKISSMPSTVKTGDYTLDRFGVTTSQQSENARSMSKFDQKNIICLDDSD